MRKSTEPRNPVQLPEQLNRHLGQYVLSASAAGMGMLTLVQSAEGKIVYTPVHHVIGRNARYKLDLNHDKLSDVTLTNTYSCNIDFCVDVLSALASPGNGVEGARGFLSIPYAYALKPGSRIGPQKPFSGQLMASSDSGQGTIGRWLNVTDGYLGVKFKIKGKFHFGWARLTVQVLGSGDIKATPTGYAYETVPNKPIIAGKTKGLDVITMEAGSLGALAAGRSRLHTQKVIMRTIPLAAVTIFSPRALLFCSSSHIIKRIKRRSVT